MRGVLPFAFVAGTFLCLSGQAVADDRQICFSSGAHDAIIAACTRAIASSVVRGSDLAVAYNQRGLAYENTGKHDAAVVDFSEAIRLNPTYAIALNNRSWALNNRGEYDRAIADSTAAIKLDPKYATAYVNRGVSYENKGECDKAISDYGEAIKLNPKFAGAYNNRGVCYNDKGDFGRAIQDFDEAIRLSPKETSPYFNRGASYEKKGDAERALANYRAVLRLKPNDPAAMAAVQEVERRRAESAGIDLAAVETVQNPAQPQAASSGARREPPVVQIFPPGRRLALVIGNSAYRFANKLLNPSNDAIDMVRALQNLNFEVVEGRDLDKRQMEDKLREFGRKLDGGNLALFFYAGHAIQVDGRNYLLPIDAKLERAGDLSLDTIDVSLVLAQMETVDRVNLILLDACGDNPLARSLARTLGARSASVGRGLARFHGDVGTMIAYATQPDNVALDGEGRNSPFTSALLKQIGTPGLEISSIMQRVRADVIRMTNHKQVPWESSSLIGDVVLAQ
jgi:tetratricopeptide (TPR) repeat protein